MATGASPAGPRLSRPSRRTFLALAGGAVLAVGGGTALSSGALSPGAGDDGGGEAFATPLAIPPLAEAKVAGGVRSYTLEARSGLTELLPGVDFRTMGYNGTFLGPTLRAARGETVRVAVTNGLTTPTTAHWHGMCLPAAQDGTPHQSISRGETWTAEWTVEQPAATLWYHPHPHGQTEEQVVRGLAGMFLIDDDADSAAAGLPSEYGVDDIPLILQDVAVASGGRAEGGRTQAPVGRLGNTVLVNGTHQAHFSASTPLVRLRVLNASSARCYNLGLKGGGRLWLVGTDGGLVPDPTALERVLLSPGERAEVLVELAPGADVVLRSFAHDLGMSSGDEQLGGARDEFDLLRISGPAGGVVASVPASLPAAAAADLPEGATVRTFDLGEKSINGATMAMDRIDLSVPAGAVELWRVGNSSDRAHNFHIHGVQFRVRSVTGNDGAGMAAQLGWKDTVLVRPGESVELVVPFGQHADPDVPYMYHCHLLWHEDQGMMGQFTVVEPGAEAEAPTTLSAASGHHH